MKHGQIVCWFLVYLFIVTPFNSFSQVSPGAPKRELKRDKSGQTVNLNKILKQAAELGTSIKNDSVRPFVLMNIAENQAEIGDFKGAFETISHIDNEFTVSTALKLVAIKQAEIGEHHSALQTAATIKWGPDKLSAFLRLAEIQAKLGNESPAKRIIQRAIEFTDKEEANSIKVDYLTDIASAQISANDRPQAIKTLQQAFNLVTRIDYESLKNKFRDPISALKDPHLVKIAKAQARAGDTKGALTSAGSIKDPKKKKYALRMIVREQVQGGDIAGVYQTAALVKDKEFQRFVRVQIMHTQARQGDSKGALKTLDTSDVQRWNRDIVGIMGLVVEAQVQAGEIEAALQTATRVKRVVPEEVILSQVAVAVAKAGNKSRAREILQMALDRASVQKEGTYILHWLVAAQAMTGEFKAALQTAHGIPDSYEKVLLLGNVALIQAETADQDGTQATFRQATQSAIALPKNRWERADSLRLIGLAQGKAGFKADAKITLTEAAKSAEAIGDFKSRPSIMSRVATAQAEVGDVEGALQTAMGLPLNYYKGRWEALQNIATVQGKRGEVQEALAWMSAQEQPLRATALLGLAKGILGHTYEESYQPAYVVWPHQLFSSLP